MRRACRILSGLCVAVVRGTSGEVDASGALGQMAAEGLVEGSACAFQFRSHFLHRKLRPERLVETGFRVSTDWGWRRLGDQGLKHIRSELSLVL